jgi:hypothetical protein
MRTCSRIGCRAAATWRPLLVLVLADRPVGYRVPLPVVVCDRHREALARLFRSPRGHAVLDGAFALRIPAFHPSWHDTVLLFTAVAPRGRASVRA